MITIDEIIEGNLLYPGVINELPRKCACGSDLVMTDNLVQLYCPNKQCFIKVANRLEEMAKYVGADDWGYATCEKVVQWFNLWSPIEVFNDALLTAYPNDVSAWDKKLNNIRQALNREWELYEVAQMIRIDGIVTTASKLFAGYSSFEEAYADIETDQAAFVSKKLNIGKGDESVMAVSMYYSLMEHKAELIRAQDFLKIKKPAQFKVVIAITGGVSGYKSKTAYVKHLNDLMNGFASVVLNGTVTTETNVLICDAGSSSSNKFKTATRFGIQVMKAEELEEQLLAIRRSREA